MRNAPPAARFGDGGLRSRRGLTVLELAVVLGVACLILSLLLPAVQASREAARAGQCRNRLRQVGLAMHNFAAARRHLPGGWAEGRVAGGAAPVPSPLVPLLPYLELNPPTGDGAEPRDRAILPAFLCPSDDAAAGGTNIRFNTGAALFVELPWSGRPPPNWPPPGAFGPFRLLTPVTLAAVTDGLSQTAAGSEKLRGPPTGSTAATTVWLTGRFDLLPRHPERRDFLELCDRAPAEPARTFRRAGSRWSRPGFHHTFYNHAAGPNRGGPDCDIYGSAAATAVGGVFPPAARHPGGVNLLLLDGAVRFVADGVDLTAWRALATRAGGDVAADF